MMKMRKLTDNDLVNITGSTVEGYHVESVRVKRGNCTDSDHYGIMLGKNACGYYVTWQFHLDENDAPNVYWGHYLMEDREAAVHDYNTRDLNIDKDAVWNEYLRYLRSWADDHSGSGFFGMSPACYDEWFGNEYPDTEAENQQHGMRRYKVTITETLKLTVNAEALDGNEAKQIISDNWHNSEYVLNADNFTGVEFSAVLAGEPDDAVNE
jgi:hypothetical protein